MVKGWLVLLMVRLTFSIWLCLFAIWGVRADAAATGAPSGHRVALLVGNARYDGFTLKGVGASLDRVEQALQKRGFRVTRLENLDEKAQRDAVESFTKSTPTNGVAVVYYAGLGASIERLGRQYNLLRPVGGSINNEGAYRSAGLDVGEMLGMFNEHSGARVSLVFLDGCWESPVKPDDEKVTNGLTAFEVGPGAAEMFAAPSGKAIATPDGDGASALAEALATHVRKLGTSVRGAFEAIAADAGKPWFAAAMQAGVGEPDDRPVTEAVRDGKTPGEGFVNSIGMTFRWCPAGSFTMGSAQADSPATRDRAPVQVTLSQGFWMGEHEVTQREYQLVRGRSVPPGFTEHRNAPFWGVTEAKQVTEFCEKLNELERKAGRLPEGWAYVCPTEAEWEYACRAGSAAAFCFGDDVSELGRYGNFADRALWEAKPDYHWATRSADDGVAEALAPVGSYQPNAWGLRDMHGNVAEVVADHLLPALPGGTDPLARAEKDGVTQTRGGAWCSQPLYCESSFRNGMTGRDKYEFIGFRIVLKKVDGKSQ